MKLLASCSRDQKNDALFDDAGLMTKILDVMRSDCSTDLLLHGLIVLKNVASDKSQASKLIELGAGKIVAKALVPTTPETGTQSADLYIQACGCLRNLIAAGLSKTDLLAYSMWSFLCNSSIDVVKQLIILLELHPTSEDLAWNACRVLSKVATSAQGQDQISQAPNAMLVLFNMLNTFKHNNGIIERVAFILSTITATNDTCRDIIAYVMVVVACHFSETSATLGTSWMSSTPRALGCVRNERMNWRV